MPPLIKSIVALGLLLLLASAKSSCKLELYIFLPEFTRSIELKHQFEYFVVVEQKFLSYKNKKVASNYERLQIFENEFRVESLKRIFPNLISLT